MTTKLLLSGTQAAKRLGISRDKLNELRDRRGLPFVVLKTRVLYPSQGLEEWVATVTQKKEPTSAD